MTNEQAEVDRLTKLRREIDRVANGLEYADPLAVVMDAAKRVVAGQWLEAYRTLKAAEKRADVYAAALGLPGAARETA